MPSRLLELGMLKLMLRQNSAPARSPVSLHRGPAGDGCHCHPCCRIYISHALQSSLSKKGKATYGEIEQLAPSQAASGGHGGKQKTDAGGPTSTSSRTGYSATAQKLPCHFV